MASRPLPLPLTYEMGTGMAPALHLTQRYQESPVKSKATQSSTLAAPKEGQQRVKHTPVAHETQRSCFYMQNLTESSHKHSG